MARWILVLAGQPLALSVHVKDCPNRDRRCAIDHSKIRRGLGGSRGCPSRRACVRRSNGSGTGRPGGRRAWPANTGRTMNGSTAGARQRAWEQHPSAAARSIVCASSPSGRKKIAGTVCGGQGREDRRGRAVPASPLTPIFRERFGPGRGICPASGDVVDRFFAAHSSLHMANEDPSNMSTSAHGLIRQIRGRGGRRDRCRV